MSGELIVNKEFVGSADEWADGGIDCDWFCDATFYVHSLLDSSFAIFSVMENKFGIVFTEVYPIRFSNPFDAYFWLLENVKGEII